MVKKEDKTDIFDGRYLYFNVYHACEFIGKEELLGLQIDLAK